MSNNSGTATAHPNIALIKYWGDRDIKLHIPSNGSISMNLAGLHTRTTATLVPGLLSDEITINGQPAVGAPQIRVSNFLNHVRELCACHDFFRIESTNNFPSGAGIASSASAFAALSLAATSACGMPLNEAELSRLARLGSGSACRSVPGGFVEWQAGDDDKSSFAFSLAPPTHWDLVDCTTIVDDQPKQMSSLQGHSLAVTSPLQAARIAHSALRLDDCRQAIMSCDFDLLARVVVLDSNIMHAVMMTSNPPLLYWRPATIAVMQAVVEWRNSGLPVCYTVDAGANVHVLCEANSSVAVVELLREIPGVLRVIEAKPGGPAILHANN